MVLSVKLHQTASTGAYVEREVWLGLVWGVKWRGWLD